MSNFFADADIIHAYTRADALADGTLIDVTKTAAEAGFNIPTAMTTAAYEDTVRWTEADQAQTYQDESGRLWDVLFMARMAAARDSGSSRLDYDLVRVPRDGETLEPQRVTLSLVIGPGDAGEPVLTIMLPNED